MPAPRLPAVGRNLANQRNPGKSEAIVSNLGATGASPNAIPCYVCKKTKSREHYSNRQLQKYQDTVYNPYAPGGRTKKDPKTTCKTCTAQQTTELTCCVCGKTKGLSGFAKNQRKNPDTARCERCVNIHLDIEPDDTSDAEYVSENESDTEVWDDGDGEDAAKSKSPASGGRRLDENTPISGSTYARSTTNSTARGNTVEDDEDDGEYERVDSATVSQPKPPQDLPAYITVTSSNSSVKKGGWGKPDRITQQEVRKSAAPQESDVWDHFYRDLGNHRNAAKKPQKKKKNQASSDSVDYEEY